MPITCFIGGCDSNMKKHGLFVTFHRIPKSAIASYLDISNRTDIDRVSFLAGGYVKYRVCSRHFKLSDFEDFEHGARRLKPEAKPSWQPVSLLEEETRSRGRKTSTAKGHQSLKRQMEEPLRSEEAPEMAAEVELSSSGARSILKEPVLQVQLIPVDKTDTVHYPSPEKLPESKLRTTLEIPVAYSAQQEHRYASTAPAMMLVTSTSGSTAVTTTVSVATSSSSTSMCTVLTTQSSHPIISSSTVSTIKVQPTLPACEPEDSDYEETFTEDYADYEDSQQPTVLDDMDPEDMDFSRTMTQMSESETNEEDEFSDVEASSTRMHIIYQSSLLELYQQVRCTCNGKLGKPKLSESKGSLLIITSDCRKCSKTFTWRSQPKLGRKSMGNVVLASSLYVTGQTFSPIAKWLELADVQFISHTTFYHYQHDFILPAIKDEYECSMKQAKTEVNAKRQPVRLCGDGRYDSPGHTARYCTYTFMETVSGKVTHNLTLETAHCSSATMAEKDGFVKNLAAAREDFASESPLETVTTDGNLSIKSYMEQNKEVMGLIHGLDLWHLTKNLGNNLFKHCKSKHQKELIQWISHITNHVWWAAASCKKDEKMLKEMVLSMTHHIVNKHEDFYGHQLFTKCAHGPLTRDQNETVKFLTPGSPAHQVLTDRLHNSRFIDQLSLASHGQHTGKLEVFHSMLLSYVPKRLDFDPPSYEGRIQLAVLDHNENVGRPVMKNDDGTDCLRLVWSRAAKDYRLRRVYVPKTYAFRERLMEKVINSASGVAPQTPKYTGKNIATKPKPQLESATSEYYKHRRHL